METIHQILLNYFEEIATTDIHGGYLQTPWHYKAFQLSNKQIRTRVTVEIFQIQIKLLSKLKFLLKLREQWQQDTGNLPILIG